MVVPAILASAAGGAVSGLLQGVLGSSAMKSASSEVLGKDDFLRLLTAQLKKQDPLHPMQSTDFVAQTAQFTSVEQLQNLNTTLQNLANHTGMNGAVSASALLGKTVSVNGSPLMLDGVASATLSYALPATASSVAVQVQDQSGKTVRTVYLGPQGLGAHQAAFDGKADDGSQLPFGAYTYSVAAADTAGKLVSGIATGAGTVTGIAVDNGALMLLFGKQRVPLSSLVGIVAGQG